MPTASRKSWMRWNSASVSSVQEGVFATPFFPPRISCNEGGLAVREGNLEVPKREPLDWQCDAFTAQALSYETEVGAETRLSLLDDLDG